MPIEDPGVDDTPVWNVWLSVYWMPALGAADELGLFDALQARPSDAEELAGRLNLNLAALRTVLPLLSALGFLSVDEGAYRLTPTARAFLLHDGPFYWGGAFGIHRGSPVHQQVVAALKAAPSEAPSVFGERPVDSWESGQLDTGLARSLAAFMHSHSQPAALGAARAGVASGVRRLLDVGGGSGCFSIAFAQADPALRCTIMELPAMAELARTYVAEAGLSDRIDTAVVDMFRQPWPRGYDAVFMSNIFHDWDEETCARLAAQAYDALPSGGRILLHEMLMADDGSGPLPSAAFSMMMLVGTRGRQYSFAELSRLLTGAGFRDVQAERTFGHFSVVSAERP